MVDPKKEMTLNLKEKMQIQLAGFIGAMVFFLCVVFIGAGFRLYRIITVSLGSFQEPSLIDALLWGYGLFFAAILIGAAVRWLLVYRWVATKKGR